MVSISEDIQFKLVAHGFCVCQQFKSSSIKKELQMNEPKDILD